MFKAKEACCYEKVKKRWALAFFTCLGAAIAVAPAPATAQATESVLHIFRDNMPKGGNAVSPLLRDAAGNLYGTTPSGGRYGAGVVYKVDSTGRETVLYSFTGGADGSSPDSGVIGDSIQRASIAYFTALPAPTAAAPKAGSFMMRQGTSTGQLPAEAQPMRVSYSCSNPSRVHTNEG